MPGRRVRQGAALQHRVLQGEGGGVARVVVAWRARLALSVPDSCVQPQRSQPRMVACSPSLRCRGRPAPAPGPGSRQQRLLKQRRVASRVGTLSRRLHSRVSRALLRTSWAVGYSPSETRGFGQSPARAGRNHRTSHPVPPGAEVQNLPLPLLPGQFRAQRADCEVGRPARPCAGGCAVLPASAAHGGRPPGSKHRLPPPTCRRWCQQCTTFQDVSDFDGSKWVPLRVPGAGPGGGRRCRGGWARVQRRRVHAQSKHECRLLHSQRAGCRYCTPRPAARHAALRAQEELPKGARSAQCAAAQAGVACRGRRHGAGAQAQASARRGTGLACGGGFPYQCIPGRPAGKRGCVHIRWPGARSERAASGGWLGRGLDCETRPATCMQLTRWLPLPAAPLHPT